MAGKIPMGWIAAGAAAIAYLAYSSARKTSLAAPGAASTRPLASAPLPSYAATSTPSGGGYGAAAPATYASAPADASSQNEDANAFMQGLTGNPVPTGG